MTDLAMEAQAAPATMNTACPQEGCIRPFPHEGVRHRFAPTKDLAAPESPAPVVEQAPIVRPDVIEKRPFNGPIEDQPVNHAISIVDGGLHVAWDHCYRCKTHITRCTCKEGPMEPPYITSWRTKDFPINKQPKGDLPKAVQVATAPVVEPEPVEAEPESVEESPTPKGTHFCTYCLADLYLEESPDGPRAFMVDGDANTCPDSALGIHNAQPHDGTTGQDRESYSDDQDRVSYGNDEPDAQTIADAEDALAREATPVQTESTIDPEVGF